MTLRKLLPVAVLIGATGASGLAHALETPHGGEYDRRIRFIDYNPAEVVKLVGHYGFSTDIQFSPSEKVEQIAMGDKDAWKVAPVKNHIFIKPKGDKPVTNMTVITSKHVYNFELSAYWSNNGAHPHPNDMFFQVNFRYPREAAARAAAEAKASAVKKRLDKPTKPTPRNWNYWATGSEEVTPVKAFDDGRFIYLTFARNSEMPAIYVVSPDGKEGLVNTHIDPSRPNTIVVEKIARHLVLRKGGAVACVFNESYDRRGVTDNSGTTTPGIKRVVKGKQ